MNDVDRLILEAWEKLGPKIMADPEELAKRLARRRMAILTRPVRAWCLAVRASDTRITPAHWVIYPEHAMDLNHPLHPCEPIEHEVTIQTHALRRYCRPVRTDSWGEEVSDVCKKLGVSRATLLAARWAGIFTERYVKGLGGKHGHHPVPLIHSWTTLDPSGSRYFARPDPLWGSLWEFLADMIPDNFEQTVIRRPHYLPHAERDVPREHWEKRQRGWRWICPACRKEVRVVFYPLAAQTLFDYLGYDPARAHCARTQSKKFLAYDIHCIDAPPPSFACGQCHRITSFSRVGPRGWNLLVSMLTRGMLYGHEVQKPSWYRDERKRARSRQLNRSAPKREAILELVLAGDSDRRIARELMMSLPRVQNNIRHLCRQERVADRSELARKLGSPHAQPLNIFEKARQRRKRVEQLLLEGLSWREICGREQIDRATMSEDAGIIYRQHGLAPRAGVKALAEKLGVQIGGKYAHARQQKERLISLLLCGDSKRQIAKAMNISLRAVALRVWRLGKEEGVKGRKGLREKMQKSEVRIQKSEVGGGMTNDQ